MNYQVYLEDTGLPVKTASVFPPPYNSQRKVEYVQFTAKYPQWLTIRSSAAVDCAVVRPMRLGITPQVQGREIRIYLEGPMKGSLEINGTTENTLLIWAEEPRYEGFRKEWEEKQETGEYKRPLIYFGAGVHDAGILTIREDHTVLYLEEGAYVHGKVNIDHCSGVTVCGYGALSMESYPLEMRKTYQRCIDAVYCQDLIIRDITIMDSNDWSLRICGCDRVTVDNVKIIGCRGNSDGVDVCGSRDVCVKRVFTRVWDDSLVVKALDTGNAERITFQDCILWNDFARPMEVGVELRADKVRQIRFECIDIIHSPTGYPLMGIHHGDRAEVSDVTFSDIRIEDAPGAQLFDIRITPSYWNRDTRMGCIRDIHFQRISLVGNPGIPRLLSGSRLQGYDEEHDIRGVTLEDISFLGKTAHDAESLGLQTVAYAENVKILGNENDPAMQMVTTEMKISKPFSRREDGWYTGEVQISFFNPAHEDVEKEVWMELSPAHVGRYEREKKKLFLSARGEAQLTYPLLLPPGKYVLAIQSEDPQIQPAWIYLPLKWVLEEWDEDSQAAQDAAIPFVNYYGDRLGEVKAGIMDGALVLHSELLKRTDCRMIVYGAEPVEVQDQEALFSVEETDFGVVPAVINGVHGPEMAPQLRCPLEITLVFRNEPKVKEIRSVSVGGEKKEEAVIPLGDLGIRPNADHFWLELEVRAPEVEGYRYPYTLFHSVIPSSSAHMFGDCHIIQKG